jgi:hypothetical protein
MICYDGGPLVIFPLLEYLSSFCASFFSFVLFGNCLDLAGIQVPGFGVYIYAGGNLPACFIPTGRFALSDCVLVFNPLIPPCQ